ncbi:hypothetical protein HDU97_001270 [Phlyctochytrium planicorne]|nr:hypothetical protein HDU97_001270 [Phlyctochytrium planicorne]
MSLSGSPSTSAAPTPVSNSNPYWTAGVHPQQLRPNAIIDIQMDPNGNQQVNKQPSQQLSQSPAVGVYDGPGVPNANVDGEQRLRISGGPYPQPQSLGSPLPPVIPNGSWKDELHHAWKMCLSINHVNTNLPPRQKASKPPLPTSSTSATSPSTPYPNGTTTPASTPLPSTYQQPYPDSPNPGDPFNKFFGQVKTSLSKVSLKKSVDNLLEKFRNTRTSPVGSMSSLNFVGEEGVAPNAPKAVFVPAQPYVGTNGSAEASVENGHHNIPPQPTSPRPPTALPPAPSPQQVHAAGYMQQPIAPPPHRSSMEPMPPPSPSPPRHGDAGPPAYEGDVTIYPVDDKRKLAIVSSRASIGGLENGVKPLELGISRKSLQGVAHVDVKEEEVKAEVKEAVKVQEQEKNVEGLVEGKNEHSEKSENGTDKDANGDALPSVEAPGSSQPSPPSDDQTDDQQQQQQQPVQIEIRKSEDRIAPPRNHSKFYTQPYEMYVGHPASNRFEFKDKDDLPPLPPEASMQLPNQYTVPVPVIAQDSNMTFTNPVAVHVDETKGVNRRRSMMGLRSFKTFGAGGAGGDRKPFPSFSFPDLRGTVRSENVASGDAGERRRKRLSALSFFGMGGEKGGGSVRN